MVLEQAERVGVYNRSNRSKKHLSFSHLYTGLDYPGIKDYLEIEEAESETDSPVPEEKTEELGRLLTWLFGDKSKGEEPKVISQNPDLRRLASTLSSVTGRIALESGQSLDDAFESSLQSSEVFEKCLVEAKLALQKARGRLTGGYDGSTALLKIAGSIANQADALYEEMERKAKGKNKERVSE